MPHVLLCTQLHFLQGRSISLELSFVVTDLGVVEVASIGVLVGVFLLLKIRLESNESIGAVLLEQDVYFLHSFELWQRLLLFYHRYGMREVLPKCTFLAVEELF